MKKTILLILFLLFQVSLYSQAYNRIWSKVDHVGRFFEVNKNNNVLYCTIPGDIFGQIYKYNIHNPAAVLHFEFTHPAPIPGYHILRNENIKIDNSGNFIIYGRTHNPNLGTTGAYSATPIGAGVIFTGFTFIAKISPSGTILWFTYFHDLLQNTSSLAIDKNNNIYVASNRHKSHVIASSPFQGTVDAMDERSYHQVITKLSPNGQHIWSTFYCKDGSQIRNIVAANEGIYVYGDHLGGVNSNYFGTANGFQEYSSPMSSNGNASTVFLSKFSFNGTRLWSTYLGDQISKIPTNSLPSASAFTYAITTINDDVYIITDLQNITNQPQNFATTNAYLKQPAFNTTNPILTKFSGNGSRIWTTYLNAGHAVFTTTDNELMVSGEILNIHPNLNSLTTNNAFQKNHGGKYDIYTAIISNDGATLKYGSFYGFDGNDHGFAIPTKSGYYFVGYTQNNTQATTGFDMQGGLLKGGSSAVGYSSSFMSFFKKQSLNANQYAQDLKINIYPNPATNFINIETDVEISGNNTFTIFNTAGRKVWHQQATNSHTHQINVSNLSSGVYILQIKGDGINQSHKFIKK